MKWGNILPTCRKYGYFPSMGHLFSTCPILIRSYPTLSSFPAGQLLAKTGSPCDTIYILVSGRLQTIEKKASEVPYNFFDIVPFGIVGDYELFLEDTKSFATVQVREPLVRPTVPARFYLQRISANGMALFLHARLLMRKLSPQLSSSRHYLLMSYEEKCTYVICQKTGKVSPVNGIFQLRLSRELLATKTGCPLCAIYRLLRGVEHKDILALSSGKILLTSTQLGNMTNGLDPYSQKCSPPRSYFHNQQG